MAAHAHNYVNVIAHVAVKDQSQAVKACECGETHVFASSKFEIPEHLTFSPDAGDWVLEGFSLEEAVRVFTELLDARTRS